MKVMEFGKENTRKIVLVPGNMMSWRQFEHVIPYLEDDFHVIAVSTDGYDDEGTVFTTAEASAEKLEAYIREDLDGEVDLVFGESFGSATAATLFCRKKVRAKSLILSGPQYMDLGIFNAFVTKVIPHNQYRLYSKISGQKKLPLLLKLYTRSDDESLLNQFSAVPEHITLETLENCAKEGLRLYKEIDRYEPDPSAKVEIWHGGKEPNMKKAIEKLKRAFPSLTVHPFEGFGHGEIIAHPQLMSKEIRRFLDDERTGGI